MSEESRLRWQCRRGMRELDELLVRYLDECYPGDSDDDKAAFRAVLELADPSLNGYLLQRQRPSSEPIARVIDRILRRIQPDPRLRRLVAGSGVLLGIAGLACHPHLPLTLACGWLPASCGWRQRPVNWRAARGWADCSCAAFHRERGLSDPRSGPDLAAGAARNAAVCAAQDWLDSSAGPVVAWYLASCFAGCTGKPGLAPVAGHLAARWSLRSKLLTCSLSREKSQ